MSSASYANQINVGDDVYGSDGDKVGTVSESSQLFPTSSGRLSAGIAS